MIPKKAVVIITSKTILSVFFSHFGLFFAPSLSLYANDHVFELFFLFLVYLNIKVVATAAINR